MVGCSWSEFFVSGVIMADLNLLPSRFYWIYITCYWFIFHSAMIFPIVCTAYKHNLTALIGLLNFLQLFLFCNFGQKWLKWFVAPAADCLHIHEEPDMLNVHVVRLSTLCWKLIRWGKLSVLVVQCCWCIHMELHQLGVPLVVLWQKLGTTTGAPHGLCNRANLPLLPIQSTELANFF